MRAVIQRVSRAQVKTGGGTAGKIRSGLMVLLGIGRGDTIKDAQYLADKIANMRIFEDGNGKMNLSVLDTGGELLVVSQFTLYADCRKGNRPSFTDAAPPEEANRLYEEFIAHLSGKYPLKVETGVFQAEMHLEIHNEGPVTIIIDSANRAKGQGN